MLGRSAEREAAAAILARPRLSYLVAASMSSANATSGRTCSLSYLSVEAAAVLGAGLEPFEREGQHAHPALCAG